MSTLTTTQVARNTSPVDLANARAAVGASGNEADSALTRLIKVAGQLLAGERLLRRPPWRQLYVEQLGSFGGLELPLARHPIETLVSITYRGEVVEGAVVTGEWRDALTREEGFEDTRPISGALVLSREPEPRLDYAVTYYAGWLMPGEAKPWKASQVKLPGDFVKRVGHVEGDLYFECTTAGTTGVSEPTWPIVAGDEVVDGSVTWTARAAVALPEAIEQAALSLVVPMFEGFDTVPANVSDEWVDGTRIKYLAGAGDWIPSSVYEALRSYR